jgi:hypothetical protein
VRRRITGLVLLLTLVSATACRTYTPIRGVPASIPEHVRLEMHDGERIELKDARLEDDQVTGLLRRSGEPVRVPMDQIVAIESADDSGTAVVLATLLGLVVLVLAGASEASSPAPLR